MNNVAADRHSKIHLQQLNSSYVALLELRYYYYEKYFRNLGFVCSRFYFLFFSLKLTHVLLIYQCISKPILKILFGKSTRIWVSYPIWLFSLFICLSICSPEYPIRVVQLCFSCYFSWSSILPLHVTTFIVLLLLPFSRAVQLYWILFLYIILVLTVRK